MPVGFLTPATTIGYDIVMASRTVLDVVGRKYEKRLALLAPHPAHEAIDAVDLTSVRGCPVVDNSLDPLWNTWDEAFVDPNLNIISGAGAGAGVPQPGEPYHDLWATMTMSWSQDVALDGVNFDVA